MTTTTTTSNPAIGILCRRFALPGMLFQVRLSDAESNGTLVIADLEALPGSEPPRHIHSMEDEIFIIREGNITFFIGDDIVQADEGDTVFLPKAVPHHFIITSPVLKATVMATPANIEHFFRSISMPYEAAPVPPLQIPTQAEVDHFTQQAECFGMQFV